MSDALEVSEAPVFLQTTPKDLEDLARLIRKEDEQELWHIMKLTPMEAVKACYRKSDWCYSAFMGGKLVCLFGVSPAYGMKGVGVPWMLATDEINKVKKTFIKHSRSIVQQMHMDYSVLSNLAWSKNTTHIRWLRWLGFQFVEEHTLFNGEPFLQFYSRSQQCVESPKRMRDFKS